MQLEIFFDRDLQREFARQIPSLRAQLGQRLPGDWGNKYGVGGNTYRALGGYLHAPSPVYQRWANRQLMSVDRSLLEQRVGSRESFLTWHAVMVASLERHWIEEMGAPLSFAHSRKLVDLFVKWLSHYNFGASASALLVLHANCALDRQTLTKLNACLSSALPFLNPSMGDVACANAYRFCQDAITEFTESCGGTRLLFDCFGWKRGG